MRDTTLSEDHRATPKTVWRELHLDLTTSATIVALVDGGVGIAGWRFPHGFVFATYLAGAFALFGWLTYFARNVR